MIGISMSMSDVMMNFCFYIMVVTWSRSMFFSVLAGSGEMNPSGMCFVNDVSSKKINTT